MSRARILLIGAAAALVVLFLALLARSAILSTQFPGGVIVSDRYVLDSQYPGDLVVAAAEIVFTDQAHVTGSVSLVGETVRFEGQIDNDLTILADHIFLNSGEIGGKLHLLADDARIAAAVGAGAILNADSLTIEHEARFASPPEVCAANLDDGRSDAGGETITPCTRAPLDLFAQLVALRERVQSGTTPVSTVLFSNAVLLMLGMTGFTAVVALLVSIFPMRMARVVRAMRRRPAQSAALGTGILALAAGLTGAQIALLGSLRAAGLIALPIYVVFVIGVTLLTGVGLISLALLIGVQIMGASSDDAQPPVIAAAVGGAVVAVVLAIIVLQPLGQVVSLIAFAALVVVGVGAALGTRLGRSPTARAT